MSISFIHQIERMSHIETGDMMTMDQYLKMIDSVKDSRALEFQYQYLEIPLKVQGWGYFERGSFDGDPWDCYSDECDYEIHSIKDAQGKNWENLITDSEESNIIQGIIDAVKNSDDYFGEFE